MVQITCLILVIVLLPIAPLRAQTPTPIPDLIVTLHDQAGMPLPGMIVMVRDDLGTHELRRAITDTLGQANFIALPTDMIRVAVQGRLPDGAALTQIGMDAAGIAFTLGPPPTRLDLRAGPDGRVVPDPTTMVAPDIGVPWSEEDHPLPTNIALPTAPAVPVTLQPMRDLAPTAANASSAAPAPPTPEALLDAHLAAGYTAVPGVPLWAGWVLLILLGIGLFVAAVLVRRQRGH
jgi:hypothetical protein